VHRAGIPLGAILGITEDAGVAQVRGIGEAPIDINAVGKDSGLQRVGFGRLTRARKNERHYQDRSFA
jgi:hypothetical protein